MDIPFIMWSELIKFFINVTKLEEKTVLALKGEDLGGYPNGFILCKRM